MLGGYEQRQRGASTLNNQLDRNTLACITKHIILRCVCAALSQIPIHLGCFLAL